MRKANIRRKLKQEEEAKARKAAKQPKGKQR